jgi:hypothetical protein
MAWPPEERRRFIEQVNDLRSGLYVFYRYLLYVLILCVTGFAIYLYVRFSQAPNRAFLEAYFGIGYAVFLLFAIGQLLALRPRRSVSQLVTKDSQIDPETGAGRFSLRLELPGDDAGFPLRLGTKLLSVPKEDRPDDATLEKAEAYLSQGRDLETICRLLNTEYLQWSVPEQKVYQAYLKGFLDLRRSVDPKIRAGSTSASTIGPSALEPIRRQDPSTAIPEASKRELSLAELAFLLIILISIVSAVLLFLWISRTSPQ